MNETAMIKTTCPYCGVGCGVQIARDAGGAVRVLGDPEHPANFGRLCSKGSALAETIGLDGRLLHPEIHGVRASWDTALELLAHRFRRTIDAHGPDSVAFYVSGQLLTEDYYVANKLMKGFIGSGNIDTNSRLCMSSSVAGHKRAFGEDVVPGCYEDLEQADLIVLVGSNAAWCHPILFQRIAKAKKHNAALRIVSIDPRRTATCDLADLHLSLKPGTDVALFNGLLTHLRRHDRLDFAFLENHVRGFASALEEALATMPSIPAVADACGLKEDEVATFFQWFARTEKTVTAWSQGVNQSSSGSDKVNAIINVHLATGRIGKPGMGPLSFTGQPNAMGGREVGGLANQLAAHMELDHPDHRDIVGRFWNTPRLAGGPGLKAVELFEAAAAGRIKALWIMATNPAVSLPDVESVRRALASCEFVVVSDCEDETDLKPYAHVRLPALAWGEKDGTVTNSERRISRQRPFLSPPGEARADWWAITEVARRMGYGEAFPYRSVHEIFREHAELSGFRNEGRRLFDISLLGELDARAYDTLQPIQWPVTDRQPYGVARLFGDGHFAHGDGKARMLALRPKAPVNALDETYPLVLNTGRIRDQWHTMTRTARSPRLNQHISEPCAEIHPSDAARFGIQGGALCRLQSRWGEALARAKISQDQRPGSVFLPMHWSDRYAKRALANALVNPAADPISGEPESKHTPVRIEPYRPAWHGFLISREPQSVPDASWRVSVRGDDYWLYELAGETVPDHWPNWARRTLAGHREGDEWLDFADPGAGRYRCALLRQGRLMSCLFVSPNHELPPRNWLTGLFAESALPARSRVSLLAGRPASVDDDQGRIVCACFGIGLNTLTRAIRQHGYTTPEQIGAALRAGTNCGSCVPELKTLLAETGAKMEMR
jgi:assimilatory nitrate reductase catalytic subunit